MSIVCNQSFIAVTHPIEGSSANITASASTVLGVANGGNTATAFKPAGTNARTEGGAPFGGPPPPGVPGNAFPVRIFFVYENSCNEV
jgi:hypothetical protein